MQRIKVDLESRHGIKIQKTDFESFKSVMNIIKKLITKIFSAPPVLSFKLLPADSYSDDNKDYQLTKTFYEIFKSSDDGYDDENLNEYIRLFVLAEYIVHKFGKTQHKIDLVDILELRVPKICSMLSSLSRLAYIRATIEPDINNVLQEIKELKLYEERELETINTQSKYYNDNQITRESLEIEIEKMKRKIEKESLSNREIKSKFDSVKQLNLHRQNQHKESLQKLEKLKETKVQLNSSIKDLEFYTKFNKKEAEVKCDRLKQDYANLETEYVTILQKKADLNFKINDGESLERNRRFIKDRVKNLQKLSQECDNLKNRMHEVVRTGEITKLEKNLAQMNNDINYVQSETEEINQRVLKTLEEIASIEKIQNTLEAELEFHKTCLKMCHKKSLELSNEIENINKGYDNMYKVYKNSLKDSHKSHEESKNGILKNLKTK